MIQILFFLFKKNLYTEETFTNRSSSFIRHPKARHWSAPAVISGTLPSFVFLIATSLFVRDHSYKCINLSWRGLKPSRGLPVDFDKKPCQVDQPLLPSLHCLWQIWRLKDAHISKALSVLNKLQAFDPGNVINVGWNFYRKRIEFKSVMIPIFAQLNVFTTNK